LEEELKRKTVLAPPGQGALPVSEGKAEIGVAQSSEIAELKKLKSVRLLPNAPASQTRFLASVATKATDQHLARLFLEYLVSNETEKRRIESGFSLD
jgi:ABC-type molybdate transport system substrate-binding protein